MIDDSNEIEYVTQEIIKRFGVNAVHVARSLDEIADAMPDISSVALGMIEYFGDDAEHIAREMADITARIPDMQYGGVWRDIADSVEGLRLWLISRDAIHLH